MNLPLSGIPHIIRVPDAKYIAMGLTGVAHSTGIFASNVNPAGISSINKVCIHYSYFPARNSVNDTKFNQFNYAIGFPINKRNSITIQYIVFNFGKFDYDDDNSGMREIKISASHKFILGSNQLALGASIKYLDAYSFFSGNTLLADFGMNYIRPIQENELKIGCSIINIGNDIKHKNKFAFDDPVNLIRIGFSYLINEYKDENLNLLISTEYQRSIMDEEIVPYPPLIINDIRWNHLGIGIELQFFNSLFARFGYNLNLEDISEKYAIKGFTYGIGFDLPEKVNIIFPMKLGFGMSRGLKDYRELENTIFSVYLSM